MGWLGNKWITGIIIGLVIGIILYQINLRLMGGVDRYVLYILLILGWLFFWNKLELMQIRIERLEVLRGKSTREEIR